MSGAGGRGSRGVVIAAALALLLLAPSLTLLAPPADAQKSSDPWWGPSSRDAPTSGWAIRIPVTVTNDRSYSLMNQSVMVELDFAKILVEAGWTSQAFQNEARLTGFTLDIDSLRVVRYARGFAGGPIQGQATEPVPHVTFPSLLSAARTRDYDASRNPAVTVMFLVNGIAPGDTQFYYVYANPLEYGKSAPATFDLAKRAPLDSFLWGTQGTTVYGYVPDQSNQLHRIHVADIMGQRNKVEIFQYQSGRFQPVVTTATFPNPTTLQPLTSTQFYVPSSTAFKIVSEHPIAVAMTGVTTPGGSIGISAERSGFVPADTGSFAGTRFTVLGTFGNTATNNFNGPITVLRASYGTTTVQVNGVQAVTLNEARPVQTVNIAMGWNMIRSNAPILVTYDTQVLTFPTHPVPAITGGPSGLDFFTLLPNDGGELHLCPEANATVRVLDVANPLRQLYPEGPATSTPAARLAEAEGCKTVRATGSFPNGNPLEIFSTHEPVDPAGDAAVPLRVTVAAKGRTNGLGVERGPIGPFAGLHGTDILAEGPSVGLFGHYPDTKVTITEQRTRGAPVTITRNIPADGFLQVTPAAPTEDSAKTYSITATKPVTAVSTAPARSGNGTQHAYTFALGGRPLTIPTTVGDAEFRGPLVELRSPEKPDRQDFRSTGPGNAVTFPLLVENLGQWIGGSNLPDDIEISCTGAPDGWTVEGCDRRFRLDSDAPERFSVTVTPSVDDVNTTRILTVTARSASGVASTFKLIVHVEIRYGIGMWFDVEGGRKTIDPPIGLDPAGTHRYSIVVKNTGSSTDRFLLDVENAREGWTQRLLQDGEPVTQVTLDGGESTTLHFVVTAPNSETAQQNIVRITGTSVSNALAADVVNTATRIRPKVDVRLSLDVPTRVAIPNETATFNVTVNNSGNDIFRIMLRQEGALPQGWTSNLSVTEIDIGPGQPYTLTLSVTPPLHARAGDLSTLKVAAETDTGDGGGATRGDEVSAVVVVRRIHNLTTGALDDAIAEPGARFTYALPITNSGNGDETIEVLPGASTPPWRLTSSSASLFLQREEQGELQVQVEVPEGTPPGDVNYTFPVRLSREAVQNLTIPVKVLPIARLSYAGLEPLQILAGATRTVTTTVTNTGNIPADYVPRLDMPEGWTATFTPTHLELEPGESARLTFTLNASRDAPDGDHALTLRADPESGIDGEVPIPARLGRADLYVERIDTTGRPRAGDLVLVQASIGNRGIQAAENVTVALVVDQRVVDTVTLARVPVGGTTLAALSWLATGATTDVQVIIDPDETLDEPAREGNTAQVEFASRFDVPAPGALWLISGVALMALALRRRMRA